MKRNSQGFTPPLVIFSVKPPPSPQRPGLVTYLQCRESLLLVSHLVSLTIELTIKSYSDFDER